MATDSRSAAHASFWSAAEIVARQGIQLLVLVVLMRLIPPEEFGSVALMSVFVIVGTMFSDSGFASALIQRQDVGRDEESSVFWFNLGASTTIALMIWALGPAIASYFKVAVLGDMAPLIALIVPANALGSVQAALLAKRLDFRTQAVARIFSASCSGTLAIAMALFGYGVWALAWQMLAYATLNTLALWGLSSWRPTAKFRPIAMKRLFNYGAFLVAARAIEGIYYRLPGLLIGKYFGLSPLGFYDRSDTVKSYASGTFALIVDRVTFPWFAANVGDTKLLRQGFSTAIRSAMLINAPTMFGVTVVADPLVSTLFGKEWLQAVPYLQILCLGGVMAPIISTNITLLMATGRSRTLFGIEIAKAVVGLMMLSTAASFGVLAIAWSQLAFALPAAWISGALADRLIGYPVARQLLDVGPILAIASAMALLVAAFGYVASPWLSDPALLAAQVTLGVAIYATLTLIFLRRTLFEARTLLFKSSERGVTRR